MQKLSKKLSGFTLIELLVVISIIGILAALILANMVGIRERAADTKTKNDMNQLKTALRIVYNDTQSYPGGMSVPCRGVVPDTILADENIPELCTYSVTQVTWEGYIAHVELLSSAGDDDLKSAAACGVSGSFQEGDYYVCAK